MRTAEQLLQPIAEHDGNNLNGAVIDKEPTLWADAGRVASVRECP
jgi:hypothetical protein